MCIDFMCQKLGLNVVVVTSSSRTLALGMCTEINESEIRTQCSSSTDI